MNYTITRGNYEKMGLLREKDRATFTFAGEKEDACFVVLVDEKEEQEIRILVPPEYCFGSLRSIQISGIPMDKFYYYYEVNGKKYLDPYARGIAGREVWNEIDRAEKDYRVYATFPNMNFSWDDDKAPEIPKEKMIMYKLHVRGFTMDHAGVGRNAGKFAGVQNKIPYLTKTLCVCRCIVHCHCKKLALKSGVQIYIFKKFVQGTAKVFCCLCLFCAC